MKYVFVLEDEERFQKEIFESLHKIDNQIHVRFFSSLESFSQFIQNVIKTGWQVIHQSGVAYKNDPNKVSSNLTAEAKLVLLVCKDELLGHQRKGLLEKTRDLFIRKGLCTKEDPTSIVITSFDRPDFNIKAVEEVYITNVIYKPFDPLILQQHLHLALHGHHVLRSSVVHQMKTQVKVEMIKEATAEIVSDVGFITRSPREISVGQVAKYYGEIFRSKNINFVFAKCYKCEPHPEISGEFRCWFTFLGSRPDSHQDYRVNLARLKLPEVSILKSTEMTTLSAKQRIQICLFDYEDDRRQALKQIVQEHFNYVDILEVGSFEELTRIIDPMLADSHQKYDSWNGIDDFRIVLDLTGKNIVKFSTDLSDGKRFLGLTQAEWGKKNFLSCISPASENVWLKIIVQKKVSVQENMIQFKTENGIFLLKCKNIQSIQDPEQGPLTEVTFEKPSPDEKIKWYSATSQLQAPIRAILAADLTIPLIEVKEWLNVADIHKSKFGIQWTVSLYSEEAPSEDSLRALPLWISDYFILSPERMHWLRKLNLFLKIEFDANFKFQTYNLEISVANPIEIQEISEASLVIKYYRPISIGSFRQFVLPRATGEEIKAYLANCNFSEVNPNNKNEHLNYFVFFGITDTYLKNIRIWIRENYVKSKEKES